MESAASSSATSPPPGEDLSAWLDGECDSRAAEPLLNACLGSTEGVRRVREWCYVGDALRSHEVAAGDSPRLCARIAAALRDEPALLAPHALPAARRPALRRHLASGLAVAAAAAVVVFVAVPQLRSGLNVAAPQVAQAPAGNAGLALANGNAPARAGQRNPRLDPYLEAHGDMVGGGVMPAAAVYLRYGNEGER